MSTQLKDRYATVSQAAEALQIHPESVRRLIRQGRLQASLLGTVYVIERAYLSRFAANYDSRPGKNPERRPWSAKKTGKKAGKKKSGLWGR